MTTDGERALEEARQRHKDRANFIALWEQHGGSQHGPHVEHVSMPMYDNFFEFCEALRALSSPEPAPSAEVMPVDMEVKLRRALTFKEAEWIMSAICRHAGDGGVTAPFGYVVEYCGVDLFSRDKSITEIYNGCSIIPVFAARAKPGEKGGADD